MLEPGTYGLKVDRYYAGNYLIVSQCITLSINRHYQECPRMPSMPPSASARRQPTNNDSSRSKTPAALLTANSPRSRAPTHAEHEGSTVRNQVGYSADRRQNGGLPGPVVERLSAVPPAAPRRSSI